MVCECGYAARREFGQKQTMGDSCSGSPSVKTRLLYFSRGWQHCGGISCSWRPHACRLITDPATRGPRSFSDTSTCKQTFLDSTGFPCKLQFSFFTKVFFQKTNKQTKKRDKSINYYMQFGQQPKLGSITTPHCSEQNNELNLQICLGSLCV